MAWRLEIDGLGETIVNRRLLNFEHDLAEPTEALLAIATIMRQGVERQFESEGAYGSGGWPALAPSTVRSKAAEGLDPRILRATQRLFEALTRKFDPEHIERLSGASLLFGADVPYGAFHQSSAPRTRLPFRPPIAPPEGEKRSMVRVAQAALVAAARGDVFDPDMVRLT